MSERDARWLMQKQHNIHGLQKTHSYRAWRILGGRYQPVPKTGETRWTHPDLDRPIVTGRRKNVSRQLTKEILRLIELLIVNKRQH